jgi:hypothetical protein
VGAFNLKNSTASCFTLEVAKRPSGAGFARVLLTETETVKSTTHEFWVRRGGLGALVLENSTASCFVKEVAKRPSGAGFARVLSTETETSQTHQTRVLG